MRRRRTDMLPRVILALIFLTIAAGIIAIPYIDGAQDLPAPDPSPRVTAPPTLVVRP
jgi:hypothetical protein